MSIDGTEFNSSKKEVVASQVEYRDPAKRRKRRACGTMAMVSSSDFERPKVDRNFDVEPPASPYAIIRTPHRRERCTRQRMMVRT